ncbi:MAG: hypothetical protein RLZZ306_507 [Bacteroidota bacterium]|jgi:hypothetical protein
MKNLAKILILSVLPYFGLAQSKIDMKSNNITINRPLVIEHNTTTAMEIRSPLNFPSEFFFFEGNSYSGAMRRSGAALQFDFGNNVFFDVGSPSRRTSIQSTGVVTQGSFRSQDLSFTTTNTAQIKPIFADKDGNLVVNNATTHYQSYNFTAVQAQDYDDQLRRGSGFAWFNTTTVGATMYLPVNLPDGVKVTNVRMYVKDNSASNISFTFTKNDHLSNAFTAIASAQSASNVASVFSINDSTVNEVINNLDNSYYVNISSAGSWTGNTLQFHSLVISYQYQ